MYNSIKKYYDSGRYTDEQVKVFVKAAWTDESQYKEITSKAYTE